MATTVDEAFHNFNRDYVNLAPERTKLARSSRDWLFEQLKSLPTKDPSFPHFYEDKHIYFGSFARNTKLRPLDDIDLMLTFHAQMSTYEVLFTGVEYIIRSPDSATTLRRLRNDDGTLNSIKVVNALVSALGKIDQYKNAELHREGEAATLQLSSYEWNFDIVPAFHTDTGHYLIPDGTGNWKPTDPRKDRTRLGRINAQHGGKLLQVIRTLKYWNRRAKMTEIPPYVFENMILNYFETQAEITEFIDLSIIEFLSYLVTGIHYDVPDPKGFQGNLNKLSSLQRDTISAKAADAVARALEARRLESSMNHEAAIRKWAEIFGPDFK